MAIKKVFKFWLINARVGLMRRMAYPISFFLVCVGVVLQVLFSVVFAKIIFKAIDNIAGWNYDQALIVVASYMIIEGLMWGVCACLVGVTRTVYYGTLDSLLVKPVDIQILVTFWRSDPEDFVRIITAFVLLFIAIDKLNISSTSLFINGFFYLIFIFNAFIILYSVQLMIKTIVFWTIDSGSLWRLTEIMTKSSQYPVDIFFHKFVRVIFSTILPLAFIATVPAKIFIHGFNWPLFFASSFLAIFSFFISRKIFMYGLRHYASASS